MWADNYIKQLQAGIAVKFRPRGHSMTGIVNDGQLVTVLPFQNMGEALKGRVVLCKVKGKQYLHKVLQADVKKGRYKIGNNHGGTNGWANRDQIYGLVVAVED